MFYKFLKCYISIALKVYFKKITYAGRHRVPKGVPVLLCANHPNSFVDALLVGGFAPRDTHFVVRGDVFLKRFLWFFRWTKQIPVFRFRDGYANLQKNKDSFELCYRTLGEGAAITIFSEGLCVTEKRLRPIQKGTAKMAFGAQELFGKQPLNIQLVPIGINYTYPTKFRAEALVRYGNPIQLNDYLATYEENPNKGVRLLTQELENRMAEHIIIIDNKADEALFEYCLPLLRTSHIKAFSNAVFVEDDQQLEAEKTLGKRLNQMDASQKDELATRAKAIETCLKPYRLTSTDLLSYEQGRRDTPFATFSFTVLAPIFAIGALLNALPYLLAKNVTARRVKKVEYWSSVFIGVGLLGYLLYMLFSFIILISCFNWLVGVAFVFLTPLLGYAALSYKEQLDQRNAHRRVSQLRSKNISLYGKLLADIKTFESVLF